MKSAIKIFAFCLVCYDAGAQNRSQTTDDGPEEEQQSETTAATPQSKRKQQAAGKPKITSYRQLKQMEADGELADENAAGNATDEEGDVVLTGKLTPARLATIKDFGLPESGNDYTPDEDAEQYLKDRLKDFHVLVFMGTWDPDSQEEIPELLRVLKDIQYPVTHFSIYGLDKFKQGQNNEAETYDLSVVPTILLMDGEKEAGRIEGLPRETIEKDLRNLISIYSDGYEGNPTDF